MTVSLAVEGVSYSGFEGLRLTQSLIDVSDTFSVSLATEGGDPFPFVGQEACKVFLDDELKLTGTIERLNFSGTADTHTISISGRDKCGDLLDSMLGPLEDLQGTLSLKRICEQVIDHLGLKIEVNDLVNPKVFQSFVDLSSPDPGQTAFEYLEPLSRARQVLLTSNKDGNLLITRSSGVEAKGAFIHHRIGDPELRNNVLDYSGVRDFTGRFSIYQMVGSMSVAATALGSIGLSAEYMANQLSLVRDRSIRPGRQMVVVDESLMTTGDGNARARWERDSRISKGNAFTVVVDGHRHDGGELWESNTLIPVLSEYAGINDIMLVAKVQFNQSPDTRTILTLVDENAYTLSVSEPTEEPFGAIR